MAQWVKDPVKSLVWLGLLLWLRFIPWCGNFHLPQAGKKKKKRKNKSNYSTVLMLKLHYIARLSPNRCLLGSYRIVAEQLTNPISIHEDSGSISGLIQWGKDLALP